MTAESQPGTYALSGRVVIVMEALLRPAERRGDRRGHAGRRIASAAQDHSSEQLFFRQAGIPFPWLHLTVQKLLT